MSLKPVHVSTSAFPERAGVVAPTALVEPTSMRQSELTEHNSDAACPTCGRDDFEGRRGVKLHHARTHDERLDDRPVLECEHCGEQFRVKPCRESEARFCSQGCGARWRADNKSAEEFPGYEGGKVTKECEICGQEYKARRYRAEESKTCSNKCAGEYRSKNYSGTDSPHWRGGKCVSDAVKKNISDGSWVKIAESEREHGPRECDLCGRSGDTLEQRLDVHHIVPLTAGGTNGSWNLMTLCRSCHRNVESYTRDLPGMEAVLTE